MKPSSLEEKNEILFERERPDFFIYQMLRLAKHVILIDGGCNKPAIKLQRIFCINFLSTQKQRNFEFQKKNELQMKSCVLNTRFWRLTIELPVQCFMCDGVSATKSPSSLIRNI